MLLLSNKWILWPYFTAGLVALILNSHLENVLIVLCWSDLGSRCVWSITNIPFCPNVCFHDGVIAEDVQCECPSLRIEMCIFTWPYCCIHTSPLSKVKAAKAVGVFSVEFGGVTRIWERRQGRGASTSHARISVTVSSTLSSRLFPHWLPICLLYPQETTATANNLLSPRYPFL